MISDASLMSFNVNYDFRLDVGPLMIAVNGCCSCKSMMMTEYKLQRQHTFILFENDHVIKITTLYFCISQVFTDFFL